MYLTQLRAFHAVATCGGFTKAAEELKLTQPSISEHIRTLEQDFGVLLFDRHQRSVNPTKLGRQLFAITRRLFETEQDALELLSEVHVLNRGFLSIGADGPTYVMGLIAEFREKYPGITITLNTGNSSEVHNQLLDYRADVVIGGPMPVDDRVFRKLIRRDPMVAYVSATHSWASQKSISIKQFQDEPIVMREKGSTTRRLAEEAFESNAIQPGNVFEVNGQEAARAAVAAGIGASIISIPELGDDIRLKALPIDDVELYMDEFVTCLKDRQHLRIIESFMALVIPPEQAVAPYQAR
jgi:aminoethylphosphonate catabolism LysR family transcriptional regulator